MNLPYAICPPAMSLDTGSWMRRRAGLVMLIVASLPVIPHLSAGATRTHQPSQATHEQQRIISDDEELNSALPSLHLLMKPLFVSSQGSDSRPEPIAINITMTLRVGSERFGPDRPLLSLPLMIAKTPSARYDDDNPLLASIDDGDFVRLKYRDEDPVEGPRLWYLDENKLEGKSAAKEMSVIAVRFTAPYRRTDEKTLPGPRVDLRRVSHNQAAW